MLDSDRSSKIRLDQFRPGGQIRSGYEGLD
jgi:hypothetical protein